MRFWQRLRGVMDDEGISLTDLADVTHKTTRVAQRWVNGTQTPSLETIILIADGLDMTASELLEGVDS